ncbi:MAG: alpha-amylase family glycosyl hydrolase [Promethearchaeota archaeon]
MDENNDGLGDLKGIISKLDYLKWLGIDAIWLSPFYPSPMEDFGYDVSNYVNVHPIFGSLDDFDELIEKIHKLGLRVIVDFVPNHSSKEHPWFKESSSLRNNPKRDWYVWRDPSNDGGPPNNWICVPGGSAWTWDEDTKQYYLHSFLSCQPDLNWRNPKLSEAMLDVLRFWLDRNVDGFRVDMISWLSKDPEFRDDPLNPNFNPKTDYGYMKLDHKYSKDGPELFDILSKISEVLDEYNGDQILIGEADYYLSLKKLNQYHQSGIDVPANFRLVYLPWQPSILSEFIKQYEKEVTLHTNYQLGNHDHSRIASRVGLDQARVAAMLLFTLQGTLFVYYGEELGMENVNIPSDRMKDPWEKFESGKGRDPERTPFQWTSNKNAGFSKKTPWLPIANNFHLINVEKQKEDPKSFLSLYRQLISIRAKNPSLALGNFQLVKNVPSECFVYQRSLDQTTFIIALNFSDITQEFTIQDLTGSDIMLSTYMDRKGLITTNKIALRGNEGCLISK